MDKSRLYESLIPEEFLDRVPRKVQVFTVDNLVTGFYLQPDTEFIVFDLKTKKTWKDYLRGFAADYPRWIREEPIFRKAVESICPEFKTVRIGMKQFYSDFKYRLDYNTKDLNYLNNRRLSRYPQPICEWHKGSFMTVLPVYYFTPVGPKIERIITILPNEKPVHEQPVEV